MSLHLTLGTLHKPELLLGLLGEEKWGYWYLGQPWEEELVFQWIECEENRGEPLLPYPQIFYKEPTVLYGNATVMCLSVASDLVILMLSPSGAYGPECHSPVPRSIVQGTKVLQNHIFPSVVSSGQEALF